MLIYCDVKEEEKEESKKVTQERQIAWLHEKKDIPNFVELFA